MKRIVICCDGTSNKPDAPYVTNVVKIARGIVDETIDELTRVETPQVVFYDQGVGSDGKLDTITGGGFGHGLAKNIQEAYRFIVLNHSPGDELYIFGFSRGAFTARSLAGLIKNFGIIPATEIQKIRATMDQYRDGGDSVVKNPYMAKIKFLGVWDTVGAMGVPTNRIAGALGSWVGSAVRPFTWLPDSWTPDFLRRKFSSAGRAVAKRFNLPKGKYAWLDATLSDVVENGYHAVAIDERRPVFDVVLWDQDPVAGQNIKQVWFSGVHTEVGGGSSNEGTSAIALEWMSNMAHSHGLGFTAEFDKEVSDLLKEPFQKISSSPPKAWCAAGSLWRDIDVKGTGTETVDPRAIDRYISPTENYEPNSLHDYLKTPAGKQALAEGNARVQAKIAAKAQAAAAVQATQP